MYFLRSEFCHFYCWQRIEIQAGICEGILRYADVFFRYGRKRENLRRGWRERAYLLEAPGRSEWFPI